MLRIRSILLAALVAGLLAAPAMAQIEKETDSAKLVAILKSADAPLFDKAKACQRLAIVGDKDAVPVLAGLLADEKLSHYARFGLQPMPFPEAGDALREAIGKLEGKLLIGAINSVGMRRDAKAVEVLAKKLGDSDRAVASAAAAALGRIADEPATKALQQAWQKATPETRPAIADACLTLADQLIAKGHGGDAKDIYRELAKADLPKHQKVAAVQHAIVAAQDVGLLAQQLKSSDKAMFNAALAASRKLKGDAVTETLAAELDKLDPQRQALVLVAMGDRADAAALPTAVKAAKSNFPEVRLAAVQVLSKIGDASAMAVLFDAAVQGEGDLAKAAVTGLVSIEGKQIDEAVVAKIGQGEAKARCVAIDLAGQRRIAAAVPALTKAAADKDEQVRVAAIKALGLTLDPAKDLPSLIARVTGASAAADKAAAQEALKAATMRSPDREAAAQQVVAALKKADPETQKFFFALLREIGGQNALQALAAATKDSATADEATRVLGEWMSPDAAPVLLELSKSLEDNRFKVRALRGYIRIARQLNLPGEERIAMYRTAVKAAWRVDEKKVVLEALGASRNPPPENITLAAEFVATDASIKDAAADTAIEIAEKIVRSSPNEVSAAMKKLLESGVGAEQQKKAKSLLNRATKKG